MKYIKEFESKKKYNIGDFVILKMIPNYGNVDNIDINLYVKIIDIELKSYSDPDPETFKFETIIGGDIIFGYVYLIRKRMTKKDISDIEYKKTQLRYNL